VKVYDTDKGKARPDPGGKNKHVAASQGPSLLLIPAADAAAFCHCVEIACRNNWVTDANESLGEAYRSTSEVRRNGEMKGDGDE